MKALLFRTTDIFRLGYQDAWYLSLRSNSSPSPIQAGPLIIDLPRRIITTGRNFLGEEGNWSSACNKRGAALDDGRLVILHSNVRPHLPSYQSIKPISPLNVVCICFSIRFTSSTISSRMHTGRRVKITKLGTIRRPNFICYPLISIPQISSALSFLNGKISVYLSYAITYLFALNQNCY
jgi:hypothetical protein